MCITKSQKIAYIDKAYSRFRDIIEHEDNLVNIRITWLLSINGFLLTAYGLVSSINGGVKEKLSKYLPYISLVGILSCIFGIFGIAAAYKAIRNVTNEFLLILLRKRIDEYNYPVVGNFNTHFLGIVSGVGISVTVFIFWLITIEKIPNIIIFIIPVIILTGTLIYTFFPLLIDISTEGKSGDGSLLNDIKLNDKITLLRKIFADGKLYYFSVFIMSYLISGFTIMIYYLTEMEYFLK